MRSVNKGLRKPLGFYGTRCQRRRLEFVYGLLQSAFDIFAHEGQDLVAVVIGGLRQVHGRIDRSEIEPFRGKPSSSVHGRIDRSERVATYPMEQRRVHGRIDRSEKL